jgi:hypothetical protein
MAVEHEVICKTKVSNTIWCTTPMEFEFGVLSVLADDTPQTFHYQDEKIWG